MQKFSIVEELIDPKDFNRLRGSVGWETHREEDVEIALKNTLFIIVAKNNSGRIIGMARVIGDEGMYYYIQDVIVLPGFQGIGIGNALMERIEDYLNRNTKPGLFIGLMAAKGKEGFYRKLGFIDRPAENYGAGMCKEIVE